MAAAPQAESPYPTVYGLWTNKGGVGKSTLTIHMSTMYSKLFPQKKVVVVDMCPQCNTSSTLLTHIAGNGEGNLTIRKCKKSAGRKDLVVGMYAH
jgi:cellulose biosynthesis protein BcsQ